MPGFPENLITTPWSPNSLIPKILSPEFCVLGPVFMAFFTFFDIFLIFFVFCANIHPASDAVLIRRKEVPKDGMETKTV